MNPIQVLGPLAEYTFQLIKEKKYKDTSLQVSCRRCLSKGPHVFQRFEIGGGWLPFSGKKIFFCHNCCSELLENGATITTWTDRIEAAIHAGKNKDALWELEIMLTSSQKLTAKDREEIIRLKSEFNKTNADIELLSRKLRELIDRFKKNT